MADIKVEHLAQLMLGVARSQLAVLDSIESLKAGFKTGHARSIIETASRIRSNHPETLGIFRRGCCCRCWGAIRPMPSASLAS